jgi:hypothetical protein
MEPAPWNYRPAAMAAKKVLTDRFSKILPTYLPSQYFAVLWSSIDHLVKNVILNDNQILTSSEKQRLNIRDVWDVVRFTLKGGTSILEAINFILKLDGKDVDIEKIRDNWENSDWDSMMMVNPNLPENVYFIVLNLCFNQIFYATRLFRKQFDGYLNENINEYTFDLTQEEIAKIYPPEKWLKSRNPYTPQEAARESAKITGSIASIRAIPTTGVSHIFRDFLHNESFRLKTRDDNTKTKSWKLGEIRFSNHLLQEYGNNPNAVQRQVYINKEPGHFNTGLSSITFDVKNNGYLQESVLRHIKTDVTLNSDKKFNYNFDLYRLMIPYQLIITTKTGKRLITNGSSELIDITMQYRSFQKYFDKLTPDSILPTVGIPTKKGWKRIEKRPFPSVGIEYNIDDMIRVINETGNKDGKLEKRCRRTLGLLKIKCKEEKYYKPDQVQDENRCDPKIPKELNEQVCRDNPSMQIDWGSCINLENGSEMTKNQLIDWFDEELSGPRRRVKRSTLDNFKKEYLCHIYVRYYKWKKEFPEISNQLRLLLNQIFVIYEKELEIHPKLVTPTIDLPENLLDVLLLRNLFIDLQFREFLYTIKETLVKDVAKAFTEIEKTLNPKYFEGIYTIGGSAYTLLHDLVKAELSNSNISSDTLVPPYKSFDFDSNIYTTVPCEKLEKTRTFQNILNYLINTVQLSQKDVDKLNQSSPRFKIVNRDNLKDVQEKWHYKYLSNIIAPTEVYEGRGSPYTFLSMDRYRQDIVVRLNIIVFDAEHDFYRMEHFVELFFRCVHKLPGFQQGPYWLVSPSGMKFASPSTLFKQSYDAMLSRKQSQNVKWAIDRDRLSYLCHMGNFYFHTFKKRLLSDDQFKKCQEVLSLEKEAEDEFRKAQEYMISFVRSKNEMRDPGSPPPFIEIDQEVIEIPVKGQSSKSGYPGYPETYPKSMYPKK